MVIIFSRHDLQILYFLCGVLILDKPLHCDDYHRLIFFLFLTNG